MLPERTLADRARRALRASGGRADEREVLTALFGPAVDVSRWAGLVNEVLAPLPDVRRAADGHWELSSSSSTCARRPTEVTFVALATAVTSADPWRARLISLAAVRVNDGKLAGVFATAFNPACRVPRYLIEATGLGPAELDEAPAFGQLVGDLLDFLGDDVLAGVEIDAQLASLASELSRLDLPGLSNPLLDLGDLAGRLGLVDGKPGLPSLACAMGLTHPRPYHPSTDARVAARLAIKLLTKGEAHGLGTADLFGARSQSEPPGALLGPLPPPAPDGPGIYLLKDRSGRVLYVGKARSLKRRLVAYHRRQLGILRRMEGLTAAVEYVETVAASSELEALILEAHLLRQHRPPYNTQRRPRPPAVFLRADPAVGRATLTDCRDVAPDGAHYLGPFRTARAAAAALSLVRALFPGLKGRARKTAADRAPLVQAALLFLTGQKDKVLERLRAEQRAMAKAGNLAGLTASRDLLRRAVEFELDCSTVGGQPLEDRLLVLSPNDSGFSAHLIDRGYLIASFDVGDEAEARRWADCLEAPRPPYDESIDQQDIVLRWLCHLGADHRVIRLERPS